MEGQSCRKQKLRGYLLLGTISHILVEDSEEMAPGVEKNFAMMS